jgi:hypothetical protein
MECDACNKEATHSFNLRYSNVRQVRHKCCKKHHNIAMSKLRVFLKHVKKKVAKDNNE